MNNHGFILLSSKIILNKVAFRLPPYLILLLGLEVVLADAADGAYPIVGDVLKRCSCGDAAIGITYCGVVDVTANFTNVLHKLLNFLVINEG